LEKGLWQMNTFFSTVPVVYINLDDAIDRRRCLETEFETHKIVAERLEAVLWTRLSELEQSSYYSDRLNRAQYHSALVNGEKGCYASHIEAWRLLLSSNHSCMVVLEDDVRLTSDFCSVITAVANLDIPWDMVKLIGREQEKISATKLLVKNFHLIDYSRVPSYTAGYVISRSGAEKMLSTRVPFGRPIDVDLRFWWENNLIIYGIWPSVLKFDQTSDVTTIAGRKASSSLISKWRKFKMKLMLTLGNILHRAKRKKAF
jgi:glycosyl transferase family 25